MPSVQFSHSLMSDSLRPHGLKHSRLAHHHLLPELANLVFIESVMTSNHLILCSPLLLLPSIFPSIKVFSNDSALPIRWPKYQIHVIYFNFLPCLSSILPYYNISSMLMDFFVHYNLPKDLEKYLAQ